MKYHSKLTGTFLIGVFAANTALASTLPIKTQTTSTAITIGGKPGGCPTQLDSAKEGARYVAGMLTYVFLCVFVQYNLMQNVSCQLLFQ